MARIRFVATMPNEDVRGPLELEEWGLLSTRVRAGEYAFFVASGLSATAGLPTGAELARKMIERLYPRILTSDTAVQEFRKRFDYGGDLALPEVAELIETKHGEDKLIKHLLGCTRWNAAKPSSAHDFFRLLAQWMEPGKPMRIITTNFDDLLERSLPPGREVIVTRAQYLAVREDEPWVLKIHGCIKTEPRKTIRVTATDLGKRLELWKRLAIQAIVARRGLIVIGYGATDIHVKRTVLSAIRQSASETYWVSTGEPPQDVLTSLYRRQGRYLQTDASSFFENLGMKE